MLAEANIEECAAIFIDLLKLEAITALSTLIDERGIDLLLDLVSDPVPAVRSGAFAALARLEPTTFLSVLAGLDADADWTVRTALAGALGGDKATHTM